MFLLGIALAALPALALPAAAVPQLLVDMHTGEVLYEEDAGAPWHPASLTKLMTAYVTFEAIADGRVSLTTPVITSPHALEVPPSKVGFPVDTAVTLEDALYLLIVQSANDMAVAIAETVSGSEAAFIAEMNRTAQYMGLTASHFVNPHGLHDTVQTMSARDLAVLALAIRARYPQYDHLFETQVVRLGPSNLRSHNELLANYSGTTGMKTGYVCSAGLNIVATVERDGRALLAVVLGGSSGRERGEMAARLITGALRGQLTGTGRLVTAIVNETNLAPVDMRPYVCGSESAAYVAQRAEMFPFGLEGQPSFLNDAVQAISYLVRPLGRIRDVPLPRERPVWAPMPMVTVAAQDLDVGLGSPVPLPRPRPPIGWAELR
jgi:D-alanyl-D-alanine carboxypeptidase